ncbi:hypothetical protein LIER_42247 [Lithospermum erythrorhizon]|uniref:Retroviral polymerase SH3-like domain-containing protein n=1 Tax=Lithospermum erythrorhizon TaxID=34254 RepID=A0AAV3RQ14_LITER
MCAAIQLINLSPSTILEGDVCDEVWFKKSKSYKHLRIFGCKAFVHISKDERTKFDNKSRQCILLSFGDEKFGYKLYDLVEKKIIRSRDVVFMENQTNKHFDKVEELEDNNEDLIDLHFEDEDY